MPVAAKIEKPASGEVVNGKSKNASDASNGNNAMSNPINMFQDPQKIANSIIEKKIRNLEKRKTRLLELKALEDKGQQLEADQKIAVKKLDNVVEMIDMLKEIGKNVTDGLNEFSKQLKKQQKKEHIEKQAERQQQDLQRSRFWLNSQLIVNKYLPLESVKSDLSQGKIGEIKIEATQVEALEKLNEFMSPLTFDVIESSIEKINNLLEGNKREFNSGITYLDMKELLGKFIDSKYFENVVTPTVNSSNENAKSTVEVNVTPNEPIQNETEVKSDEQGDVKQPVQNVHHINNQLCFMRDTVVENELQHKDPAVVAVASLGFPYPPQNVQALSTSGSNIPANTMSANYPPQIFPAVSIPTQTFTNPSYIHGSYMIPANHYQVPITDQQIPVTSHNVLADPSVVVIQSDKNGEMTNEKTQHLSPESNQKEASQDVDGKPATNGHFENRAPFQKNRGRGRGGYREYNPSYHRGGRGGNVNGNKGNFGGSGGYYNNNGGNSQNPSFNPNSRPVNRQNGNGPHRPPYRQENHNRGVRNQNQFEQVDSVAANQ